MKRIVINGADLLLIRGGNWHVERGSLVVEGNRIAEINQSVYHQTGEDEKIIDGSNLLVMPGLINTHYHSYDSLSKGVGDGWPGGTWVISRLLNSILNRSPEDIYLSAVLGCVEMVRTGT